MLFFLLLYLLLSTDIFLFRSVEQEFAVSCFLSYSFVTAVIMPSLILLDNTAITRQLDRLVSPLSEFSPKLLLKHAVAFCSSFS